MLVESDLGLSGLQTRGECCGGKQIISSDTPDPRRIGPRSEKPAAQRTPWHTRYQRAAAAAPAQAMALLQANLSSALGLQKPRPTVPLSWARRYSRSASRAATPHRMHVTVPGRWEACLPC